MADEVKQLMGIDVTQAIGAVEKLQTKLANFGASLGTLAGQLTSFNGTAQAAFDFGNTNKTLGKTVEVLDQLGNPVKNLSTAATSATKLGEAASKAGTQIKAGLGTGVSASIDNLSKRFGTVGALLNKLGTAGVANITAITRATKTLVVQGGANLSTISGGLSTIARVITTQVIVRSLSAILRAFEGAVAGAVEFQRTIAEITTLGGGDFFNTFDNAAKVVRKLSDEFNAPIGQVGEGLYQVISNQIQGAANQVDVLTESLRLSKAGISDVGSAVNLVTGTINAFQLSQQNADRVSAVFFKTVELGRARIDELANTFGTVAPLAGEAGLRFEELAGAFSTLTINGIDVAKAGTQLRGIISALLKPTKALKDFFDEAGFSSGQTALESIGLVGVLKLLDQATGGSAEAMAKYVPRVRGLAGAQVLARDGAEGLAASIKDTENAARDLAAQKVEIIFATPAEKVTKAINKIKNALTIGLGQTFLKIATNLEGFIGGLSKFAGAIEFATPFIATLITTLGLYTSAVLVSSAANTTFAKSFFSLFTAANAARTSISGALSILAATGVTAAISINAAAEAQAKQSADNAVKLAKDTTDKIFAEERRSIQTRLSLEKERIREESSITSLSLANTRSKLTARTRVFSEENDKIRKDTERVFKAIQDANNNLLSNLTRQREQATSAAIASEERLGDRRAALADLQFGFENRRFSIIQRSVNAEDRASKLGQAAAKALAGAESEREIAAAQALAQRAEGFQQEALALAEQSNDRSLIAQQQQASVALQNQLIQGEQSQNALQKKRIAEAKALESTEKARVTTLNEQIQKATDLQAQLKFGDDVVDRSDIIKQLKTTLAQIDTLSVPANGKLQASDIFAFADFRKDILESVGQLEVEGIDVKGIISGSTLSDFEARFEAAVVEATTNGLRKALAGGISLEDVRSASLLTSTNAPTAAIDALQQSVNSFRDKSLRIAENTATLAESSILMKQATLEQGAIIDRNIGLFEAFRGAVGQTVGRLSEVVETLVIGGQTVTGQNPQTLTASAAEPLLKNLQQQVLELVSNAEGLPAQALQAKLDSLNSQVNEFRSRIAASAKLVLSQDLKTLDLQIEQADKRLQESLRNGTLTSEQQQQQLQGIQEQGKAADNNTRALETNTEGFSQAANSGAQNLQASAQFATIINQQLSAAATASSRLGGGGGVTARAGKFIPKFLASGGMPSRGTDTIPAMLSPGEFVVNARSTKRFFSQLQSMNAGRQPVFRQDGGPVTNVGDINVTVDGGKESASTGRQIARSIRRELRRGTSSL